MLLSVKAKLLFTIYLEIAKFMIFLKKLYNPSDTKFENVQTAHEPTCVRQSSGKSV